MTKANYKPRDPICPFGQETNAPLEWWEEIQLNLLESLLRDEPIEGIDVASMRANPAEWRTLRQRITEEKAKAEREKTEILSEGLV